MSQKRQVAESESESVSGVLFGERQDSIPLIPINVINSFFLLLFRLLGDLPMDDFDLPSLLDITIIAPCTALIVITGCQACFVRYVPA